ncbi:MAG: LytTR family DNA-binding domain-containing protein [Polaribacter sp.]|uniref:LytR/AlgR family response regulator transcription factor n=1 Tax=Polaribacter sp. TaxID=1920175 RepID=UPI002F358A42
MKNYNAIIVDDEKKNIEILEHFLLKFCPLINIVASITSIDEAVKVIDSEKPDILYLDINLKKGTSFEILEKINFTNAIVIFITAYKDFAIKAIKKNAIDYILKPLSIEDVILATNKAINKIEEKEELLSVIQSNTTKNYITIHSIECIEIIQKKDILYCESDGRYTILTLIGRKVTASKNLGIFEESLKEGFIRVHNSFIINLNHVKVVHKKNGFFCEMINGKKVPVSKRKQFLITEL